jgi:hypothetical protein
MFRLFIFLIVTICVTACGPSAKLRRAEKLIAKAEAQGAQWHTDSVVVEIPVPVESVRVDTVEKVLPGDSIIIEKERLKVIVKRLPGDTIRVTGECKADTIKVRVTKRITKTIKADGFSLWQLIIMALVMLLAGYGVRAFMRR